MTKPLHPVMTDDKLEVDDEGNLHWRGRKVVTEQKFTVRGFERGIAILGIVCAGLGTLAALIQAADVVWKWLDGP
jgi:hypothetical protein